MISVARGRWGGEQAIITFILYESLPRLALTKVSALTKI